MLFTPFSIGNLKLLNRFVRSATADIELSFEKKVRKSTLDKYEDLAINDIGMIITGDFPVVDIDMIKKKHYDYKHIRIGNVNLIADCVHGNSNDSKIIAQLSTESIYFIPSEYNSPWGTEGMHICSFEEIQFIERCFIKTALHMKSEGFDGIQLHSAHGGFLSLFLSPYSNHRKDAYGGNAENRCRLITNIIRGIKKEEPDFPVLIKINAHEYLPEGMDRQSLQETVKYLEDAGADAIEYSGGLWEAMSLSDEELGFPAIPSLEAHTNIDSTAKQSYFCKYAEEIKSNTPVILVGGNRNIDLMEEIVTKGTADLVAICRPLICEPDLIKTWKHNPLYKPACISCNACIYDMFVHPWEKESSGIHCLYNLSRTSDVWMDRYIDGLNWLKNWKKENL